MSSNFTFEHLRAMRDQRPATFAEYRLQALLLEPLTVEEIIGHSSPQELIKLPSAVAQYFYDRWLIDTGAEEV